ncbi:uncharacterized protein LOC134837580 [Culicoides brevitarsis]|uniref:uncharacterized protein LOC134837580 n=1 Tax=Culicoides brevitarsis TaxID=469753 RepID=UPI00307C3D14
MLFSLLILISCAVPVLLFWINRKWAEEDARVNLPGPKAYPIIGSLPEMWSGIKNQKLFMKILECAEKYGDTFRIRLGPKLLIFTRDLKIIEKIASDPKMIKGHEYKSLVPMMGNGLLISGGERWFKLRRLITPAFHFQILERFLPIYEEQADVLISKFNKNLGKVIDVVPMLHNMALDIIAETAMGVKLSSQSGKHQEFVDANEEMLHIFTTRMNNGFLTNEFIFRLTPYYQAQTRAMKVINALVDDMIEKRRDELINESKDKNVENDFETKKRPTLIEILLQSNMDGKPLTNDDIRNEVKTFMLAGHETTSNALGFFFYNVAKYPEIQVKVLDEIKSLYDPKEPLTTKILNSFTYLDCVIKESLRMFPAGTMLPKRCLDDVRIGDVLIPADTTIMTLIYASHMNEKNFGDSKKFNPERWMEEVSNEERNPFAYQPFSSGLRNCIGQRFALLEIKTVIIKVLTQFHLDLASPDFTVDVIESGSMKSRNGVQLKMSPRKSMFVLYAILVLLPLFLYYLHHKTLENDAKVGVSGPKGLPLVGSIVELHPYAKKQQIFKKMHEYHETHGDTFQVRLGPVKMIFSRDPKITEALVNDPKMGKGNEYNMLKPWLGDSLVISDGEKWHRMRKLCTPAFHFQILERFIPIYEEQTDILIDNIRKNIGKVIDIFPKMHSLTLDIISETSMGAKLNAQSDPHHPYIVANEIVAYILDKRMFNGFLGVEWIFRLTPYYKTHNENIAKINEFIDKVIQARHEKLLKETQNARQGEETETKKRPALLDILLQAKVNGEPLTNEEIQAEVKTFMFAGHETTANSVAFTLYLLAKHPEIQEKVYDEIRSKSLDVKSEPLTSRDLNSLSYLDNVCKESLRLFPPASVVIKKCNADVRIGNLLIPKNTSISTNIYSAHRNAKYFKNPEKFDPDRFNVELTADERNPYAYQPFSSGLRNCIGQKFANLEMKTIISKLVSAFQFELEDKDFEPDVIQMGTLRSKNGIPLKFMERN